MTAQEEANRQASAAFDDMIKKMQELNLHRLEIAKEKSMLSMRIDKLSDDENRIKEEIESLYQRMHNAFNRQLR